MKRVADRTLRRLRNIEQALLQFHKRLRRLERARERESRQLGDFIGFRISQDE